MVYTRSYKQNIINIIEKLESDTVQLKKENTDLDKKNSELDKKNRELEEEIACLKKKKNRLIKKKNELVNKYNNPTDTKDAVNRILDLLLKFPNVYYGSSEFFHERLYAELVDHLCMGEPDTYDRLINKRYNLIEKVIIDSEIDKKYFELIEKNDEYYDNYRKSNA
jgi:seryl-tRNA synthetase